MIVCINFVCYSCDNSICETCEEADDDEGDLDDVSCDCLYIIHVDFIPVSAIILHLIDCKSNVVYRWAL